MIGWLLGLWLACSGTTEGGAGKPKAGDGTAAALTVDTDGAWRLALDELGGEKGAPRGMAFLFPPGAPVSAKAGELSDGSRGFTFSAPEEGNPVVCTQPIPVSARMQVGVRMRLAEIVPGPQKFMGLTVELRSRDASGNLLSPASGRYTPIRSFREPGEWSAWEAPVQPVSGASTGEFCFRFVRSTGKVEVDAIVIAPEGVALGMAAGGAAAGSAGAGSAGAGSAEAGSEVGSESVVSEAQEPVCPEGCCPCAEAASGAAPGKPGGAGKPEAGKPGKPVAPGKPEAGKPEAAIPDSPRGTSSKEIAGIPIKWEMNQSIGGLPSGFEFIPGKSPKTSVGMYRGDETGLAITSTGGDGSVSCSERFVSGQRLIVRGRVQVTGIVLDPAKSNSAFIVEVRNYSADGKLLQTQSVRFQRVFVVETLVDWFEFSKDVKPPAETAFSRLCARFVEASGEAAVDWLSVSPG